MVGTVEVDVSVADSAVEILAFCHRKEEHSI